MNKLKNNIIDTSSLKEGQIFKNYKQLCLTLGEPCYTHFSKESQLKRWKRFFDFEQIANSYSIRIVKIYEQPLPPKKQTRYKRDKFAEKIFPLLLIWVAKPKAITKHRAHNQTIILSKTSLFTNLGLVNAKFFDLMSATQLQKPSEAENRKTFGEAPYESNKSFKFSVDTREERFLSYINSLAWQEISKKLNRALENLQKLDQIEYKILYLIQEKNSPQKAYATPSQIEIIQKAEQDALKKVRHKTLQQVRAHFEYQKYSKYYKENLSAHGIEKVQKLFAIHIKGDLKRLYRNTFGSSRQYIFDESIDSCSPYKEEINKYIIERLNNYFSTIAENLRKKIENKNTLSNSKKYFLEFIQSHLQRHDYLSPDSSPKEIESAFLEKCKLYIDVCINLKGNSNYFYNIINEFNKLEKSKMKAKKESLSFSDNPFDNIDF